MQHFPTPIFRMSKTAKRRIKTAKISLISLVPSGANRVTSLFKSRDGKEQEVVQMSAVAKIDAEGYLTALVYMPDDVDSQGDTADVWAVKQMAHDFIANMEGNGIDVLHDGRPVGNDRARLCETFIVQKEDPRFVGIKDDDGNAIDPTDSWGVVIKIDDPDLRSRYATGEWVGVSMFGSAIVEPVTKSTPQKEIEMDEKQMAELLKTFGKDLAESIVAGLSKAMETPSPSPAPQPEPKPVEKETEVKFEGDPNSAEDIAKHAEKVLFASLDMSNPADIKKWQDHLAAKQASVKPNPNQDRIDSLEKELRKLRGAPSSGDEPVRDTGTLTLAEKLAKGKERAVALRKAGYIR